jgi:hypothetical protein
MKVLALILAVLITTGCASNLKQSAQASVAADAATTVAGVASGVAAEANPLITSPAGLVATVALRLVIIDKINKLPEDERINALASFNSVTWGIAASNLAIIALASNPIGLAVGLVTGLSVWESTKDERLFAESCAYMKQTDPTIKCVFGKKS